MFDLLIDESRYDEAPPFGLLINESRYDGLGLLINESRYDGFSFGEGEYGPEYRPDLMQSVPGDNTSSWADKVDLTALATSSAQVAAAIINAAAGNGNMATVGVGGTIMVDGQQMTPAQAAAYLKSKQSNNTMLWVVGGAAALGLVALLMMNKRGGAMAGYRSRRRSRRVRR